MYDNLEIVERLMGFEDGGDSSKILDFLMFCNATGGSDAGNDGGGINVAGEVTTLDGPTIDINTTEPNTMTGLEIYSRRN